MIGVFECLLDGVEDSVQKQRVFSVEILGEKSQSEKKLGFDFVIRLDHQLPLQRFHERLGIGEQRTQTQIPQQQQDSNLESAKPKCQMKVFSFLTAVLQSKWADK